MDSQLRSHRILPKDVIDYSLKVLRVFSVSPLQRKELVYSATAFYCCVIAIAYIFVIMNINHIKNVDDFIGTIEGFITVSHAAVKLTTVVYYREDMVSLFTTSEQLWEQSSKESITAVKIENKVKLLYKCCRFFHTWSITCGSLYIITCLLVEGQQLPFSGYIPNPNAYKFILLCDCIVVTLVGNVVVITDILLASLCYSFVFLFSILCYEIRALADLPKNKILDQEYEKEICRLCEQHKLLIRCTGKIKRIFKIFLLVQLFLGTTTIVSEFYFLSESVIGIYEIIRVLMYVLAVIIELTFYCFPAEELTSEAKNVADAIFGCGWYDGNIKQLKSYILFIIMRASNTADITAGDMININRATITFVMKTSMSFVGLLASMKSE